MIRPEEPFDFAISAGKVRLNFGEDHFFEITCFSVEKSFEFPISAEKCISISVKAFFSFFFFWRSPVFGRKTASI